MLINKLYLDDNDYGALMSMIMREITLNKSNQGFVKQYENIYKKISKASCTFPKHAVMK